MLPGLQLGDQWLQAYNYKMVDDITKKYALLLPQSPPLGGL